MPSIQYKDQNENYFQAIGIIYGTIEKDPTVKEYGCCYSVNINGFKFPLQIKKQTWNAFKYAQKKILGQKLYMVVYPKMRLIPNLEPKMIFCLQYWSKQTLSVGDGESRENSFILRGIWQFIPQYRFPVVTVSRNYDSKEKKEELQAKGEKFPMNHVSLMWKEAVVKPFKFNPKKAKDEQAKRYFVSVKAKFIPKIGSFAFQSLLSMPTSEIPRFIKPIKKAVTDKPSDKRPKLILKN